MTDEPSRKDREPHRRPPPLDEDPGKGQFYFPGRPRGCLSALLVLATLAACTLAA